MKKKIFSLLIIISLCSACGDDDTGINNEKQDIVLKTVSFDTDQNSTLMFQDDQALEVMTSEALVYSMGQVIRVKPIDEKTIEVSNFAPIDIEDATIVATIGGNVPVQLFKIKKIRAHATQTIKYPFVDGTTQFLDTNNKEVDLSQYKTTGVAVDNISFDFTGDNKTILMLKKLKSLKWTIKYHNYDPTNDPNNNWMPTTAKDIRRFSGLMLNMGIVFVSDEFKQAFLNETIIGNDGVTALTMAEKEKVYNDILNHPRFNCGKVDKVSGLGLGPTIGYAEHILHDYIKIDAGDITAHEIGHCIGFNHESNMTYPKTINSVSTGFSPVMTRLNKVFFKEGLFIVTPQNYYKPADFQ